MSTSPSSCYGDVELFKESINEAGKTIDDDKVNQITKYVDGKLNDVFVHVLGESVPFSPVPNWFKTLATEGYTARYWFQENNDKYIWDDYKNRITEVYTFRFENPAAATR